MVKKLENALPYGWEGQRKVKLEIEEQKNGNFQVTATLWYWHDGWYSLDYEGTNTYLTETPDELPGLIAQINTFITPQKTKKDPIALFVKDYEDLG